MTGRVRAMLLLSLLMMAGCHSASEEALQVRAARDGDQRETLGQVQSNLRVGMSGAEVVQALGSPNMVTTDEARREFWVYDRVSTESVGSSSGGRVFLLLGGVHGQSGASSTSQRTQTVVVKFDDAKRVRDFAYRASSF